MNRERDIHHISIKNYTYNLPDERIAKYPLDERDQSKLLVWEKGEISDHQFKELPVLLPAKSILVFNNTRVIRARLLFRKKTGALIEIFCLEPTNPSDYAMSFAQTSLCHWKCVIGNKKRWKEEVLEQKIVINHSTILLKAEKFCLIEGENEILFSWDNPLYTFSEILEACGNIPIPPYLNRESEEKDLVSYQTVYSKIKGSVAAPTAGLHFTDKIFDSLIEKGIRYEELTLHVGAGTFQPVKTETIADHKMHTEHFVVSHRLIKKIIAHEGKIIAVGTTSVRTLESLYQIGRKILNEDTLLPEMLAVKQWEAYESGHNTYTTEETLTAISDYMEQYHLSELNTSTQIIILPGYDFKIIDGLVTNFHQPQSTLLLLIAAFLGDDWRNIYRHALLNGYRFLSYGDSNLYLR